MPKFLFGELRAPRCPDYRGGKAVEPHENVNSPNSLIILNAENALTIKDFFNAAFTSPILKGFYENILLIYAVDGDGNIHLAIEELYKQVGKGIESGIARLVKHEPHKGLPKLGHPSLLPIKDKQARLAGEIYYKDGVWYINDSSGRYTKRSDDNKAYINNVAELFLGFGIVLKSE